MKKGWPGTRSHPATPFSLVWGEQSGMSWPLGRSLAAQRWGRDASWKGGQAAGPGSLETQGAPNPGSAFRRPVLNRPCTRTEHSPHVLHLGVPAPSSSGRRLGPNASARSGKRRAAREGSAGMAGDVPWRPEPRMLALPLEETSRAQ